MKYEVKLVMTITVEADSQTEALVLAEETLKTAEIGAEAEGILSVGLDYFTVDAIA